MLLLKIVFEQESKKIEKTNSSDVLSALFKNVHGQYFNTVIHGRYLKPLPAAKTRKIIQSYIFMLIPFPDHDSIFLCVF